ncbi:alpha-(1,3)-fucosyltransferase C-like [Ruditapes philippinarum]|uniref:alpha-(1,3)-fucosyltransferase C-like n=1 Tax=Ruditapes philippinarum TaxID=129788 RepID=UPI00295B63D6|nr:alpha-(1,3)-fucosyltransferase C-like [Ruditapes philippinarum]
MKTGFITFVRKICFLLVIVGIICVVFVNIQFNMKGYWLMPTALSYSFENVKNFIRNSNISKPEVEKQSRRRLINVFEGVQVKKKSGKFADTVMQFSDNNTRIDVDSNKETEKENRKVNILWYNKPAWIDLSFANRVLPSDCIYRNCRMSDDKSDIQKYGAVVFTLTQQLDIIPPVVKNERNGDQVWIFFGLESPVNHKLINYRHNSWMDTMNWSMSYRLDSDIFFPYGMLEERKEVPIKDYSAIYHLKTKQAAWLVSNCGAPSRRDDFVSELKRSGLEVDIFGVCSDNVFHNRGDMTKLIDQEYQFYLSFENSLCQDYITEKFFRYYNLNVILVTRGGADYDHALPNDTFINSAHFTTARALVKFLHKVGSSKTLYTDFLRRKDKYFAHELFTMTTGYCSMCEKLNNLNRNRRMYADHVTYIHEETCWEPSDIQSITTQFNYNVVLIISLPVLFLISLLLCYFARNHVHTSFSRCLRKE